MPAGIHRQLVDIGGSDAGLVERFSEPVRSALAGRRSWYGVRIEPVGRTGEVMLRIDGVDGHLALVLGRAEMEPRQLASLVRRTVLRLDL